MAALWCQKGEGTAVDPERCAHWIERLQALADDGNLEAQWELSCMQRWGDIVSLDIRIANHWLERAAKGGYGEAQHLLAWYYQTGQGGLKSQVQHLANPLISSSLAIASSGVSQSRV